MKKIFLIGITAAGIFASSGASAITSFGASDCGAWIKTPTPSLRSWVLGYISGINTAIGKEREYDPLEQISSAEQIYAWMDNYCKKNPLEKLTDGSIELYNELQNRTKKR